MRYEDPIEWPAFVAWIQTLITHRGENLLRIKGIVNIDGEDNPVAIHGVQHVFHPRFACQNGQAKIMTLALFSSHANWNKR